MIIDWFKSTGRENMLLIEKDKNLTPKQWIEVFTEYFTTNPNVTSIPSLTTFTSAKHGLQNIGNKMNTLKQVFNNRRGTPSVDNQMIINWFIKNNRLDFLELERTPEQWIEVFTEYFTDNPGVTSIPPLTTFTSANHGVQDIGSKINHLKKSYNNGQGTPYTDTQKIIDWFIENNHENMLNKAVNLTPEQWIEVFDKYFIENPNVTSIPPGTTFTSANYGVQDIGSKIHHLKKSYNNGQGTPSADTKKIINWFIKNNRLDFLKKDLTSKQWIEVFEEYFNENPNATSIPPSRTFTSTKYGQQKIGSKTNNLKQVFNNRRGTPSVDTKTIINWLIENNHGVILLINKPRKKTGFSDGDNDQTM